MLSMAHKLQFETFFTCCCNFYLYKTSNMYNDYKTIAMKKSLSFIAVAAVMLAMSCSSKATLPANAQTVTKDIKAAPFNAISIECSADVHFTQGNTTSVKVKASEETLQRIEIANKGNRLLIKMKPNKLKFRSFSTGDIDVYVTSPDLESLQIVGSGDFDAKQDVTAKDMSISVSGSGDIDFKNLKCNSVKISIAGSGDMKFASLKCNSLRAGVSGSGDINFSRLDVSDASFSISGSGDISVGHADIDTVQSSVAGSGDITINGAVKHQNTSVSGSGTIRINNGK